MDSVKRKRCRGSGLYYLLAQGQLSCSGVIVHPLPITVSKLQAKQTMTSDFLTSTSFIHNHFFNSWALLYIFASKNGFALLFSFFFTTWDEEGWLCHLVHSLCQCWFSLFRQPNFNITGFLGLPQCHRQLFHRLIILFVFLGTELKFPTPFP